MKVRKFLVTGLTICIILTLTVPVLADTSSSQTPSSQSTLSPQDRAAQRKEILQHEVLKIQEVQQYQQFMGPIRQLQAQEKQVRDQVRSERQQVQSQIKTDRQAKNYTALLAALNDMTSMQDDIANLETIAQTCAVDWQQLKTDKQSNNVQGITADLQKIQTDVQNRVNGLQKVLGDLQKISQDLNTANANPTPPANNPASSTTSNQAITNS